MDTLNRIIIGFELHVGGTFTEKNRVDRQGLTTTYISQCFVELQEEIRPARLVDTVIFQSAKRPVLSCRFDEVLAASMAHEEPHQAFDKPHHPQVQHHRRMHS